jgi:hypothetical protein
MRKFIKSNYKINKVTKVIKSGDVKYEVYEVIGPDNFKKDFISNQEAKSYIADFVELKYNSVINYQLKQLNK